MQRPDQRSAKNTNPPAEAGILARIALALTDWTERWVPDAFVFALLATLIVIVAGVALTPSGLPQVIDAWGKGFWELIPFTLQMALIIITGHVLATSWFNWGFSLIFSAVLAKAIARRVEGVDYRALAAASFLGLGSVWAQGLSGSAALQMATPGALQSQIREIVAHNGMIPGGIIPFRHTIFLWQSLASGVVEIALVTAVMWLVTPPAGRGKTARDLGIVLGKSEIEPPVAVVKPTPGQWLEHSPILNWLIVLIGGTYVVRYFMQAGEPLNAINLNIVNFTFLLLGFLLHKTPARLMHAVQGATPAVWGVILQFPFYAGIAGIITSTHLNEQLASAFVSLSSPATFPPLVAIYSAVLGVFVPSGGSKWVIEAPYVMEAAHTLKTHVGWVVSAYDLGEALANLVQPFWMLPILGLFHLRARDVMGYTFVVFLVLVPLVLLLVTILGATLSYPL